MSSLFFNHSKKPSTELGFSLIELMVSIGIMVIVMSVIMVRQTSFNGAVLLRSQAYEIALTLRELQLSAVSAYGDAGSFRGELYGAHFRVGDDYDGAFQIFKDDDTPADGYDVNEEFGEQGSLDPRFRISAIELDNGSTINELSIMFQRPNFDALFYNIAGENLADPAAASPVRTVQLVIERRGSDGVGREAVRKISITSAGQIAVLTDD